MVLPLQGGRQRHGCANIGQLLVPRCETQLGTRSRTEPILANSSYHGAKRSRVREAGQCQHIHIEKHKKNNKKKNAMVLSLQEGKQRHGCANIDQLLIPRCETQLGTRSRKEPTLASFSYHGAKRSWAREAGQCQRIHSNKKKRIGPVLARGQAKAWVC